MLPRNEVLLLSIALAGACSGGKGGDGSGPLPVGALAVSLELDHTGCYEDPHDHLLEVNVHELPEFATVVTFDAELEVVTSVGLSPGEYDVWAGGGWSPDGPSDSQWESACGCAGIVGDEFDPIHVEGGQRVEVTVPITCGTTSPD